MILVEDMVYNEVDGFKVDYTTYIFFNIWYIAIDILMTISNWYVFFRLRDQSLWFIRHVVYTSVSILRYGYVIKDNELAPNVESGHPKILDIDIQTGSMILFKAVNTCIVLYRGLDGITRAGK